MTSIDEIVPELTGLLEKATPGPWVVEGRPPNMRLAFAGVERPRLSPFMFIDDEQEANGAFVCAARNHLPAILSALARSRRMEEALRSVREDVMAMQKSLRDSDEEMARDATLTLAEIDAALEDNPNG